MSWTLSLGRLFGVNIKVHWTFFLLLAWVIISEYNSGSNTETIVLTTASILAIFICVVLHEMGHIQMARMFGIPTKKITLLPIGGVASLKKIPENPREELLVAIAGPLVNVLIAAIIWPFIGEVSQYLPQSKEAVASASITTDNFWFYILSINILLVIFNMIPAFPMDGGRVLRALLAMKTDRLKATSIASNIGQVLAVAFFFLGLFYNPLLILIAVFVFFGARGEHFMVQQTTLLRGHTVEEAMMTDLQKIDPYQPKVSLKEQLIATCDNDFPVFEENNYRGLINRKALLKALTQHNYSKAILDSIDSNERSIRPKMKITKILKPIQEKGCSLPVIKDSQLIGVINTGSIQRFVSVQSTLNF